MDIQQYISSGVLEQYVLGQLSPEEAQKVEAIVEQYPEIKSELDQIELALEKYSFANAIEPSPGLEQQILQKIQGRSSTISETSSASNSPHGGISNLFVTVALLLAIALACIWGIQQYQSRKSVEAEMEQLQASYNHLENDCNQQLLEKAKAEQYIDFLRRPDTKPIEMLGTPKDPDAIARIFWNATEQKTILDIINLSALPTGKQYQLWAIVEGTPKDMGVFDVASGLDNYLEVPHVENPQAFAVTIEKAGGSLEPTLSELIVIGNFS
jgi:anti-sigma-K factor RskA